MSNEKKAKKRSVGKVLAKILLWLVIILVAVTLLALWQIDRIAATGTRTVGTMLTGTKVDVSSISIKPFAGAVLVKNFTVGNPQGYHNPIAIKVGKLHVDAGMKSLMSDKVEVEHLEISGVAIDYELKIGSGSNLDAILQNVEKATGADKKAAATGKEAAADKKEEKAAAQKKVVIKKLILRDSKVTVSSSLLKTTMVVPLPPIEMENVGEGQDLAGTISEIMTRVINEVTNVADLSKIGKSLSETGNDIINNLDKATSSMGNTLVSAGDSAGKALNKTTESVGGAIVSAGDSAGKALDDTLNSTKKLLRGIPGLGK